MTPLRLEEEDFATMPDGKQDKVMFEAIERLSIKVEDLCGARKTFRRIAIKWGSISGGTAAFILILIHDPRTPLGKITSEIIRYWIGG